MSARVAGDPAGRWLAVVGPSGALLVDGGAAHVDELLTALSAGDPVQPVLDVLAGAGLGDVPDFALVLTDAAGRPGHAMIRGMPVVRTASGELTGHGVRTWREAEVEGETAVLVAPGASEGVPLPLERGAVLGGRIELAPGGTSGDEPAEPAPTASTAAPLSAETAVASVPVPIPEHTMVEPDEGGFGYDRLFESTIVRPVEDAAMRPAAEDDEQEAPAAGPVVAPAALPAPSPGGLIAASPAPDDPADDGDHDGETVLSGSIPGRAERGRPEEHEIALAAAERRFTLVLPGDRREPLIGELVIGRAPTARVVDGRVPRLVEIEGDPDVSRSHLRVALEGDTVVVTDLRSRNGTSVVLPGKAPQLLRADEPTPVIPGTVLDLGATQLLVEEDVAHAAGGAGA